MFRRENPLPHPPTRGRPESERGPHRAPSYDDSAAGRDREVRADAPSPYFLNWAASVDPSSAIVDDAPPAITCAT